jgi:regulator of sigma E protease
MLGNAASSIIIALLILGVIIVIHELGHFLVAKFFKIKVETFSVGFGPRLIGFRKGDTDYRISAFPLGGYVKMAGETPMDEIKGLEHEFLSKPKWQRFLVASAGPAMNVILAVALITGLYIYGTDVPEFLIGQAVINVVEAGSPADRAGIKPGDQIVSFDGKNSPDWQDVQNTVLTSPGRALPIVVDRNGKKLDFTITPERKGREEAGDVGMFPVIRTIVQDVQANSPASRAGVKPGDEIIRVNGIDLRTSGRTLQQTIQQMSEKTFPITVVRGQNLPKAGPAAPDRSSGFLTTLWNGVLRVLGRKPAVDAVGTSLGNAVSENPTQVALVKPEEVELQVSPEMREGRKMIGIGIQFPSVHVKLGPVDAFKKSLQSNKENAVLIFQVIGRLLRREASLKQLDGPVGIVAVSGQAYQAGFATLLTFMALISLNLGVLNILPIPILDGGVILLLVIESLLGRDLSLRMKERIVQASFVFLLMLTVIVLYNDVVKLLPPTQPTP